MEMLRSEDWFGVYHHVDPSTPVVTSMSFAFRLNEGRIGRPTMDRLESMVEGSAGKRLTYKDLIQ